MAAIETTNLGKTFGQKRALNGLNLRVKEGSIFGMLGPNGAGKTTTIRILSTLLRPTDGSATVLGYDVVKEAASVRAHVCLTGQYASVDEELTGIENLILVGRLLGLSWKDARVRGEELLEAFGLAASAGHLVRTFSGGMRRRLDLAASLVFTPQLVFLDEPTTGLDPRSRSQVWEIVRAIAAQGTTVLLTTQYMEEADRLADRLAVIDHGRVIAEGTSAELKASVGSSTLRIRLGAAPERELAEKLIREIMHVEPHGSDDPFALAANIAKDSQVPEVLALLSANGLRPQEFSIGQPSMDEVFFALTGHAAEASEEESK